MNCFKRSAITISLLAITCGMSLPAKAHGFYGGSEYLLSPPPPPPPPMREFTHLPPPPPPPPSFTSTWQQDRYRQNDKPAPWAAPLWGNYQDPRFSSQNGWDEPTFVPWNTYIQTQAPYPGMTYPPAPPSRSCVDQNCTGP